MKRIVELVVAIALLGATSAHAAKGDGWLGFQFGYSAPMAHFSDAVEPGFEGGPTWRYMESEHRGVEAEFAYHAWSASTGSDQYGGILYGYPSSVLQIDAVQLIGSGLYDMRPTARVSPFLKAGCGVYWVRSSARFGSTWYSGARRPYFGYAAGTGVHFKLGPRAGARLGATYHFIVVDGALHADVLSVGLNLTRRTLGP